MFGGLRVYSGAWENALGDANVFEFTERELKTAQCFPFDAVKVLLKHSQNKAGKY